ncbi:MAG: serine hydrolase [Bacteroidia bacterium]|jgi:beta-lactamase class A|nr:serine hydrolase [Bacteroidia bacterium]MBP7259983.1 serine hydrolase [Bacteroidia bacterium]MBP9179690.1 serine hydrolase [Bacteroidia bacterium]MBP9723911.1 serine hydrolase [Bacteroidia bacterium]
MKSKIFLAVICVTCGIGLGYFIGFNKFHKKHTTSVSSSANGSSVSFGKYINPTLSCYGPHIKELRSFRLQIEKYLNQIHQTNPELKVSYYFRDLANGIWIGINEKEEFSPASLLKLPVMIAVLREAEKNPDFFNKSIEFKSADFTGVSEEAGFPKQDGKFYTIDELITHMIAYSDNAATLLLHQYAGEVKVKEVEDFLHQHVPENGTANTNFISVKDYAAAFRVLYNCSYLGKEMSDKALSYLAQSRYKSGIRAALPDSIVLAHKYGVRDNGNVNGKEVKGYQLHHFGIIYYPAKPYLLGIMTRGGDKSIKEKVIEDLSKITFTQVDEQMKSPNFAQITP